MAPLFLRLISSFVLCTASQIIGGDFAKVCGLLRIYELYKFGGQQSEIFKALKMGASYSF